MPPPKTERNQTPVDVDPGVKIDKRTYYKKTENGAFIFHIKEEPRNINYIYPPTVGKKDVVVFFNAIPQDAKFIIPLEEINSIIYILVSVPHKSVCILYINIENSQSGLIETGEYKPSSIINYHGDFWFANHSENSEYILRKVNGIESVAHAEELIICDNLLYSDNLITITWIPEIESRDDVFIYIKIIYQVELSKTRKIIFRHEIRHIIKISEFNEIYEGNPCDAVFRFVGLGEYDPYISGKHVFIFGTMITLPDGYCD